MTYRCGVDATVADLLNTDAGPPRITCDGCGIVYQIAENRLPPAWFLDGKAPPRWVVTRDGDKRDDRCPRCRPAERKP